MQVAILAASASFLLSLAAILIGVRISEVRLRRYAGELFRESVEKQGAEVAILASRQASFESQSTSRQQDQDARILGIEERQKALELIDKLESRKRAARVPFRSFRDAMENVSTGQEFPQ